MLGLYFVVYYFLYFNFPILRGDVFSCARTFVALAAKLGSGRVSAEVPTLLPCERQPVFYMDHGWKWLGHRECHAESNGLEAWHGVFNILFSGCELFKTVGSTKMPWVLMLINVEL